MSWPQWPQSTGAVPGWSGTGLAPATAAVGQLQTPGTPYTPEQWAAMQQQNWQQWVQWQQQYQQWQQQYGEQYQKSLALAGQTSAIPLVPVQPPLPVNENKSAPPLPTDVRPPLPPEEPPKNVPLALPVTPLDFNASIPPPNIKTLPPTQFSLHHPPPKQPVLEQGLQQQIHVAREQNYTHNRYNTNNPPPSLLSLPISKPAFVENQQQHRNQNLSNKRSGDFHGDNLEDAKKNRWEENLQDKHEQKQWNNQPPQRNQQWAANKSVGQRPNVEELSEAEKNFDKQFEQWEAQFNKWKEQNAGHPDKQQYKEYEAKWESWRTQLLDRREQMRRKRLGLIGSPAQSTTTKTNVSAHPSSEVVTSSVNQSSPGQQNAETDCEKELIKPSEFTVQTSNNDLSEKIIENKKEIIPSENNISALLSQPPKEQRVNIRQRRASVKSDSDNTDTSFLQSDLKSEGCIPGLDLVKDDDTKLPDNQDDGNKKIDTKLPDYEAISKGINSILGDEKLLSMLSMVAQNKKIESLDSEIQNHTKLVQNNFQNSYQSNNSLLNQDVSEDPRGQFSENQQMQKICSLNSNDYRNPPNLISLNNQSQSELNKYTPNREGVESERVVNDYDSQNRRSNDFRMQNKGMQNLNFGNQLSNNFILQNRVSNELNETPENNFNSNLNSLQQEHSLRGPNFKTTMDFNHGISNRISNNLNNFSNKEEERNYSQGSRYRRPGDFPQDPPDRRQDDFSQGSSDRISGGFSQGPPDRRPGGFSHSSLDRRLGDFSQGLPDRRPGDFSQDIPDRWLADFSQAPPDRRPGDFTQGPLDRRPGDFIQGSLERRPGNFSQGLLDRRPGGFTQVPPDRRSGDFSQGPFDREPGNFSQCPPQRGSNDFSRGPHNKRQSDFSQYPPNRRPVDFNQDISNRDPIGSHFRGHGNFNRGANNCDIGMQNKNIASVELSQNQKNNGPGEFNHRPKTKGTEPLIQGPPTNIDPNDFHRPNNFSRTHEREQYHLNQDQSKDFNNFQGPQIGRPGNFSRAQSGGNFKQGPHIRGQRYLNQDEGFENFDDSSLNRNSGELEHDAMNEGPSEFIMHPPNRGHLNKNFVDVNRGLGDYNQGAEIRGFDDINSVNRCPVNFDKTTNRDPDISTQWPSNRDPNIFDKRLPNRGPISFKSGFPNRGLNDGNHEQHNFYQGPNWCSSKPAVSKEFGQRNSDSEAIVEENFSGDLKNSNLISVDENIPSDINCSHSKITDEDYGTEEIKFDNSGNFSHHCSEKWTGNNLENLKSLDKTSFVNSNLVQSNPDNIFKGSSDKYWDEALILKPVTVIDYGHKSLNRTDSSFMEPVQTFDYGHSSKNVDKNMCEVESLRDLPSKFQKFRNTVSKYNDDYPPKMSYNKLGNKEDYNRKSFNNRKSQDKFERFVHKNNKFMEKQSDDNKDQFVEKSYKDNKDQYEDIDDYEDDPFEEPEFNQSSNERDLEPYLNKPNPSFVGDSQLSKPKEKSVIMIEDLLTAPGRNSRPPRIVIILRGPPGSGKTFLAKLIKDKEVEQGGSAPRILSLDDYFMVEQDKEIFDKETGRRTTVKEMVYEYEECMELAYRQSLEKAFKKTITDGFFPFIILDCINDKTKYFSEMWSFAKQNGFQVYVCQMELDVAACTKRNIHHRSEIEIERLVAGWEVTPNHYLTLDASSLIQAGCISEVEMEEVIEIDDEEKDDEDPEGHVISKWERMEHSGEKLARLDGTSKPLRPRATMEDYLQIDDEIPEEKQGQKRVRWADLEECRRQDKMRAIGFVVGQTDWDRMMDPTQGGSALTQTKYIERVRRF